MADPVIRALANLLESAMDNVQQRTRHALDHGEPLYSLCACTVDVGDQRCACAVELAASRGWMRRAQQRLAQGEFVGMPPRRRCRLCVRGEHDLVDTYEVQVSVSGSEAYRPMRVPAPPSRKAGRQADRARRAGGARPGTAAAQREAARPA